MIKLKQILSEIVVKPTNASVKLKRALVDAMYEECIVGYDGDFGKWDTKVQTEFDNQNVSYTYYDVFQDLRKTIGDDEAEGFFMSEAPGLVEKMLEERGLDEIVVKPTERRDYVGQNFSSEEDLKRTAPEVKIDWESEPASMRLRDENGDYYYYGGLDQYGRYWSAQAYDRDYENEFHDIHRDPDNDPENLEEIVVKPAKPFVFQKGDRVKQTYSDEESAVIVDRVEDFTQVEKDSRGVNIDWIYQDEDQVTKPWYLVKYTNYSDTAFGWEPEDELELDVDDLQEIVVKPTDPTRKAKQNLVDALYGECLYDFDGNFKEWLEYGFGNFSSSPEIGEAYQALEDLIGITEAVKFYYEEAPRMVKQKLGAKGLEEIVVKPASSYRYNIGDKLQNKVGGVLVVKARYKDMEEAIKANPSEHNWAKGQIDAWTGEGRWYGITSAKGRGKKLTIVPEERLATLTKL